MAGDWIPIRCNIATDPEVIALAEETGMDEDAVVGKLHRLWSWANQHTVDGNAPSVTYSWVDRYLRCEGFAAAMESVGWLTHDGASLQFPKFDRFNSQGAKRRALTAKRVSEHKLKTNAVGNARGNARGNASSVTKCVPREEKRREEKNKGETPHTPQQLRAIGDAFVRFWDVAHHRVGKVAAEKAFVAAVKRLDAEHPERHNVRFLIDRMAEFARSPQARPLDRTPIHPATWLNSGRYDDDPATWQQNGSRGSPRPAMKVGAGHIYDPNQETRDEI